MKDASTYILGRVREITADIEAKAAQLIGNPTKELQDEFWVNTLSVAQILFECLNNAYFSDKEIHTIHRLYREEWQGEIYGVPVPSRSKHRDYDFLVLDGQGHIMSSQHIEILKSDRVTVWHKFPSKS